MLILENSSQMTDNITTFGSPTHTVISQRILFHHFSVKNNVIDILRCWLQTLRPTRYVHIWHGGDSAASGKAAIEGRQADLYHVIISRAEPIDPLI